MRLNAGARAALTAVGLVKESESRFELLVAGAPVGMAIANDREEILHSNAAYRSILGYGPDADGGKLRIETLAEDAPAEEALMAALKEGKRERYTVEKRSHRKDGTVIWTRADAWLARDAAKETPYIAYALRDITEEHMAREGARMSSGQLAARQTTAEILEQATMLEEAIPRLLHTVCSSIGWDVGAYWVLGADEVLRTTAVYPPSGSHQPLSWTIRRKLQTDRGTGLVGYVFDTGQMAEAQNGITNREPSVAEQSSGIAVPITVNGTVRGVLEFSSRDGLVVDDEMMRVMAAIGEEVSHVMRLQEARVALQESEKRAQLILETARDAVIAIDEQSRILSLNRATERLFGYETAELVGQSLTILMPPELQEPHRRAMQHYATTGKKRVQWDSLEFPGITKSGQQLSLQISLSETEHDGRRSFTGFLTDVTDRKQVEKRLSHQTNYDTLTDLPNRTLLRDRLQQALLVARRHDLTVALLFMDLDRFKTFNDSLGHTAGDSLLQQVSERLRTMLRESDTVARLGGDEFAVLLPSTGEVGALQAAERVQIAMRQPFDIEGHSYEISGSIGITVYPLHGEDAASLMRRADVAMYAAKRAASGYALYSPDQDADTPTRLILMREMRNAIESGQMVLHYQPKMNTKTRLTTEVEALIRWQHPEHGVMPPGQFISLAEETSLIRPLTEWALEEALRQRQVWARMGFEIVTAVNLSARTLHDTGLPETIGALLKKWDTAPAWLGLEITESAIMINPERAMQTLRQLHEMGVRISIDDFGTGYSSLGYLRQLPIHELKIDKSFVLHMDENHEDASIVRAVIDLGHNLGLKVVAEGAETRGAVDMLGSMGCDLIQGYFYSKPMPGGAIASWLTRESHAHVAVTDAS